MKNTTKDIFQWPRFSLTTIEYDPARARGAAGNIRRAGLADIVTVVPGDAFQQIPKLPGALDFVFLDAWKRDYKRFFDLVVPRLGPRGFLLAHNVVNKQTEMRDFLDAIATGTEPRPSFADALDVQRVLSAVVHSATNGTQWIDVTR